MPTGPFKGDSDVPRGPSTTHIAGRAATVLAALTLPAVAGVVAAAIHLSDADSQIQRAGLPPRQLFCADPRFLALKDAASLCSDWAFAEWSLYAALVATALGFMVPVLGLGVAFFAGRNRARLALLFRPTVLLCLGALAVVMVAQAIILPTALYFLFSATGRIPSGIMGALFLGSAYAAYVSIRSALHIGRSLTINVVGTPASPLLHGLVAQVAQALGATPPRTIIVGPEPTFFATSAGAVLGDVALPRGTTMYVSSTLGAVLSDNELRAVLSHEMAHFAGEDTVYSLKFAPAYRALATASAQLKAANASGGVRGLAILPASATAELLLDAFERSQSAISRERELVADAAAAHQVSADVIAGALVKATIYGNAWSALWQDVLTVATTFEQVPSAFRAAAGRLFDSESSALLGGSLIRADGRPSWSVTEPSDSHPSLADRFAALSVPLSDASIVHFGTPTANAYLL